MTWLFQPERLATYLQADGKASDLEVESARIRAAMERLRRSREGLMRVMEEGLAPTDDVVRRLKGIREREGALSVERENIEVAVAAAQERRARPEDVMRRARDALGRLRDDIPFAKRQELVRAFVRRIVVSGTTVALYRVAASAAD